MWLLILHDGDIRHKFMGLVFFYSFVRDLFALSVADSAAKIPRGYSAF